MSKTRDLANLADLNFDSGTMVVDKANDRVGVGTSSPSQKLHISGGSSTARMRFTDTAYSQSYNIGIDGSAFYIYDITDNAERMRIDSDGRVGIGISNPVSKLDLASGNITISNSTNTPYINFVDNTTRSQSLSRITMDQVSGTAGQLLFSTTTGGTLSEAMRIDNDGRVGIGTSAPSGAKLEIFTGSTTTDGLKISRYTPGNYYSTLRQDSHGLAIHVGTGGTVSERVAITPNGITFNGDTAAANALDDYEEGTWTPVDDSGAGLTFSVSTASYVRIGKTCTVHAYLTFPATSSSAIVLIGGLPFTIVGYGALALNSSVSGAHIIQLQSGATNYNIKNDTNAALSNSQFSGSFNVFSGTYIIA